MKNKISDIRTYTFSKSDALLFDANIWLYLCVPIPGDWKVKIYSNALLRILSARCSLYLDVLVLSEFINRFARLEMIKLKWDSSKFKEFRRSGDYPPVAKAIEAEVSQMLTICKPIDHPFSEWPLSDLVHDFSKGSLDWNDQLIAENCRKHGLALLTHDGDFTEGGISVFTANNKLLAAI